MVAASGAYGSGPSHYLEPLFYYSKKQKPIAIGHSQCKICKKVFDTDSHLYRHTYEVHSFNGIGRNTEYFMKSPYAERCITCIICGKDERSIDNMVAHLATNH